jgi:hypothetical protein
MLVLNNIEEFLHKIAMFVKNLKHAAGGRDFKGDASLYRFCPTFKGNDFIVISAANVEFTGSEVMAFPADDLGSIISWQEIEGIRDSLDHGELIERMGYSTEHKEDT